MQIDQLITSAVVASGPTGQGAQKAQPEVRGGTDVQRQPTVKRGDAETVQPLVLPDVEDKPESEEDLVSRQISQIEDLREVVSSQPQSVLKIDRTEESGQFVYRFLNPDTGDLVRQWPAENYVDLIEYLQSQQGGLVDERV